MDTKKELTIEQTLVCIRALSEVMDNGTTDHRCPLCGGVLKFDVSGASGDVICETKGCFGSVTFRGI